VRPYIEGGRLVSKTVLRECNLCEASCGLAVEVDHNRVVSIRPDYDDPVSRGYVCPKGMAMGEIHADPDRLRRPMRRRSDGGFDEIDWGEALDLVASRLAETRDRHGADSVALYFGNPVVHNFGAALMVGPFVAALGTRNRTSASSQDTAPRFAASYYLYGNNWSIPIPDIANTDYFLCIGANPAVSQGSLVCGPNVKSRLRAIAERGGKIVTIDPRRTETARLADEHVFIRPGNDAALLLAMTQVLVADGLSDEEGLATSARGWDQIVPRLAAFTPERVADVTGIDTATIRRLAREFVDAPTSVAYTRLGTCNNMHATVGSYATDLLNLAAGRLGKTGGALFGRPAFDICHIAPLVGINGHGRWHSRVRGLPETGGDLPASILAEEMETPGKGQVRALVTLAGNPVLSTPNGQRLRRAIETLDFYAAIDLYINETTQHADVILPPCWSLAESHMGPATANGSLRSVARWSPPVVEREPGELADWEILLAVTERLGGGPTGRWWLDRLLRFASVAGWRWTPERTADLLIRTGPEGDRYLPWSSGLNLAKIQASPYGIDLGPLTPGLARRVFHRDGRVHLDEAPIVEAIDRLADALTSDRSSVTTSPPLLLVGRRHLRSNNSWMHNAPSLVAGADRCVLLVHPDDALRLGLRDGGHAMLESRTGKGLVPIKISDEMMPGVVSLPHGWGHARSAPWQSVAGTHAGVSINDWSDDQQVERVVGQSILNGVLVHLRAAEATAVDREPSVSAA